MIYEYKGYQIKPSKENPASYIIVTEGRGGKIPKVLEGLFTSTGVAKERVDSYLTLKGAIDDNKTLVKV